MPIFLLRGERKPKSIKFKSKRNKGLRKLLLSDLIVAIYVRIPHFKATIDEVNQSIIDLFCCELIAP